MGVGTWEAGDPAYSRPIAVPLERCAELLNVDLATIRRAATDVEPYIRVDGTKVWSSCCWSDASGPRHTGGSEAATSAAGAVRQSTALGLGWKGPRRRWCLASNYGGDVAGRSAVSGKGRPAGCLT
jgi:hypothetical protein